MREENRWILTFPFHQKSAKSGGGLLVTCKAIQTNVPRSVHFDKRRPQTLELDLSSSPASSSACIAALTGRPSSGPKGLLRSPLLNGTKDALAEEEEEDGGESFGKEEFDFYEDM